MTSTPTATGLTVALFRWRSGLLEAVLSTFSYSRIKRSSVDPVSAYRGPCPICPNLLSLKIFKFLPCQMLPIPTLTYSHCLCGTLHSLWNLRMLGVLYVCESLKMITIYLYNSIKKEMCESTVIKKFSIVRWWYKWGKPRKEIMSI